MTLCIYWYQIRNYIYLPVYINENVILQKTYLSRAMTSLVLIQYPWKTKPSQQYWPRMANADYQYTTSPMKNILPVHSSHVAWLTRLKGDTSTACRRTVPARPILVESSLGPPLATASTKTWSGFCEEY